ncbi:MAG: 50S ribosomal protein L9 [Anaerolineales bacterium]|nr:50S ribosomal protein L9 [Anaerolineales bacterium]
MKVLLLKDVHKLGRAGDVKKVADGYGRNYLLPQGLAVLATPGMLKQAERIRQKATEERARLNQELGAVAERLEGLELIFPVKAGETGRLYGSVTAGLIADGILNATGITVERRHIDTQPIKNLGVHPVGIRLTIDLVPSVKIVVHRDDESPEAAYALAEEGVPAEVVEEFSELKAELEAEEAALEAESAAAEEQVSVSESSQEDVVEATGEETTAEG